MNKEIQKGFTLIELMIVIAIVGILGVIALPAYQNYVARAQMGEALMLAGGQKAAVTESRSNKGVWPVDNAAAGVGEPASITGTYVQKVEIGTLNNQGLIVATMKNTNTTKAVQGKTLTLKVTEADGAYTWMCNADVDPQVIPASCR